MLHPDYTSLLFLKQFPLYLYGELTFEEEETVEQHLESCSGCRASLEAEKRIHRSMAAVELRPTQVPGIRGDVYFYEQAALKIKEGQRSDNQFTGTMPVQICNLVDSFELVELTVNCEMVDCFCCDC